MKFFRKMQKSKDIKKALKSLYGHLSVIGEQILKVMKNQKGDP